jgi:lipoprotein-releasing system ATP-binding protein
MKRDIILSTNGLGKYFNDSIKLKVLDAVNFDVNKGEFLTIVGKSGCGKSTLLYCLSTMDTTYEGDLFINR